MPLDITGSYASSGSSGASARDAVRVSRDPTSPAVAFGSAALSARQEKPREEVAVSSSSSNVAVYVSPFIRLDITSRLAIVEIRNSETGEVQQQYPSPKAVREYTQNLPEDSDLLPVNKGGEQQAKPRIIGSAEDIAEQTTQAPAPQQATPTATSPQAAAAASAAFSGFSGIPTGGKQVAVA